MTVSEEFKAIIEEDIAKCKYEIDNGSIESSRELLAVRKT